MPVEDSAAPIVDDKGNIIGVVLVFRDVSERRQMQEQLVQSDKLAALGQLVSGVAHELNNPLTAVMGYTELILMRNQLDIELREQLTFVHQESERTRRIVQNLLSFARQHKPMRTFVNINDILERTLGLRNYELRSRDISVIREYSELPGVFADSHQLQQVFLNIIINAEQEMDQVSSLGQLRIKTEMSANNEAAAVLITVEDNGPGIAPDHLGKVFDPFFTTKDVGKGTGLGLSISYGIIKEHGGTIRVESPYGGGARFIIELPVEPKLVE
jgi:two-component system NtrC family sensor kinase